MVQPAITSSKSTTEALENDVKYVQRFQVFPWLNLSKYLFAGE